MEYEEMPRKEYKTAKGTKTMKKKIEPAAPKQPKSIKLSTIWKALVYTFAVIGVVLSIMYVNDIVNKVVDSRAEVKAHQLMQAQPAAAAALKTNQ